MKVNTKGFKKDDIVYHTTGGKGQLTGGFENDWSTDPPTVMAIVRVVGTMFHDIRKLKLDDLRFDRRG